jgi:hypothetical protein
MLSPQAKYYREPNKTSYGLDLSDVEASFRTNNLVAVFGVEKQNRGFERHDED